MNSNEAAETIAKALKERTGIGFSVTAGRGTMRSWVVIDIPVERRQLPTAKSEREALARYLGFPRWEGTILVKGTETARRDFIERALGLERAPSHESSSTRSSQSSDDPERNVR